MAAAAATARVVAAAAAAEDSAAVARAVRVSGVVIHPSAGRTDTPAPRCLKSSKRCWVGLGVGSSTDLTWGE